MSRVPLEVRRLLPDDDRSLFRSGNDDLDRFFHRFAGQNQFRHHLGTTYVAVDVEEHLLGFVTVVASELAPASRPASMRRLPSYPVPVLRLARLAVAEGAQGRGIGGDLLRAAFTLAHKMAEDVGCVGVLVDAKPEAIGFYERLGFLALEVESGHLGDRPEPTPMFLQLQAIPKPT